MSFRVGVGVIFVDISGIGSHVLGGKIELQINSFLKTSLATISMGLVAGAGKAEAKLGLGHEQGVGH